ncbi:MAG: winged helix-turn-helix domain-containing protein [Acidimicrobiales bacterium]
MSDDPIDISLDQARRIALGAQGFADRAPTGAVDRRHGRRVLEQVGVVQIDSVNVLCRSQELPLLARLGPHRRDLIPTMTRAGDLFEYWAHEASHVPMALHPLLRWRMDDARDGRGTWGRVARVRQDHPGLVDQVLAQVRDQGPITIGMVEGGGDRGEGMWAWSPGKVALEYLFWSGQVTAWRGPNFERWYALTERRLPASVLAAPTPTRTDAHKTLLLLAARCHGVGTARDLADYFRLNLPACRPLLAELVAEGRLQPVAVEGWRDAAFLHPDARRPNRHRGRALLSPFDSLIWERSRTERLWGYRYRIEIYVPKAKRIHGYYVLPFLLDGELVARVDLKSDRQAGVLRVQSAFGEDGIDIGYVTSELAAELRRLAAHLRLTERIEVMPHGDLAPELERALAWA